MADTENTHERELEINPDDYLPMTDEERKNLTLPEEALKTIPRSQYGYVLHSHDGEGNIWIKWRATDLIQVEPSGRTLRTREGNTLITHNGEILVSDPTETTEFRKSPNFYSF